MATHWVLIYLDDYFVIMALPIMIFTIRKKPVTRQGAYKSVTNTVNLWLPGITQDST
jgi:hypothetical protein